MVAASVFWPGGTTFPALCLQPITPLSTAAHLAQCVHCEFTHGTHTLPAVQTCPSFPILQLCNTGGYAEQPQSSWRTSRSQELLASGPFWIPASVLSPLPICLSLQTLWFCVGYLRVYFQVQAVLMGRHNHSRCDNVVNKPCQLTTENFKHFLFSLSNETT